MARILVIDDQPMILKCIKTALSSEGHDVATVAAGDLALKLLGSMPFDIIITDFLMPRMDGLEFLTMARERCPDVPVIMITGHGTADTAMAAMSQGAFDYLPKPFSLEDLRATVSAASEYIAAVQSIAELTDPKPSCFPYPGIVAVSRAMQNVCKRIEQAAKVAAPLLVCGEAGTEKELIARTVHAQTSIKKSLFIRIECEHLTESRPLPPLFRQGSGGTIYFRAVEQMPMPLQTELIRAIDRRSYQPAAGEEFVPFTARVMASTTQPLDALVANGSFRHDLAHKLKANVIAVPALRDRSEDIRIHVGLALRHVQQEVRKKTAPITPDALLILQSYTWPANVRELERAVRYAYCMARGGTISVLDLPHEILARTKLGESGAAGALDVNQFRGRVVKSFLVGQEKEYKKLINKIEGFRT